MKKLFTILSGLFTLVASSQTFLELQDTPSTYTDNAGKLAVVNSLENQLVFIEPTNVLQNINTNLSLAFVSYSIIGQDLVFYREDGTSQTNTLPPARAVGAYTHSTYVNGELTLYRGQSDPNPDILRISGDGTVSITGGATDVDYITAPNATFGRADFKDSNNDRLFSLEIPNALTNDLTDIELSSTTDTAIQLLRGHTTDGNRTEDLNLQPVITAGESKLAYSSITFDRTAPSLTLTAEDTTTTETISLPSWVEDIYLTNSPDATLAVVNRQGQVARTIDLETPINTLASNMVMAFNIPGEANIATLLETASLGTSPNDNVITFTARGGTTQTITIPKWFEPATNDRIFANQFGTTIRWDDFIRDVDTITDPVSGRDALAFYRIDSDGQNVFSPRGANWNLIPTATSGGISFVLRDNSDTPRSQTSSIRWPQELTAPDLEALVGVSFDPSSSTFNLDRRGTARDSSFTLPFALGLVWDSTANNLTLVKAGDGVSSTPTVNLASLLSSGVAGSGVVCDPMTLIGGRLNGTILEFPQENGNTLTIDLNSISSGSQLSLVGFATLMNTAATTLNVNPSNYNFVVVDGANNVRRVSVSTMIAELVRGQYVSNSALTANASSTSSTTIAPSRRAVEIALAGIETTGGAGATAFTNLTDTPSALGAEGQILKISSGAMVWTNDNTAAPGAGLDQDAVDARINALRPANRQNPDPTGFTASDNGDFPAWNNTDGEWDNASFGNLNGFTWNYNLGTSTWTVNSDNLNQTEVDARVNSVIPTNRRIPPGGTTGQVLKKDTNTDYDVSWQADNAGSGGGLTQQQVDSRIATQFPGLYYSTSQTVLQEGRGVTLSYDTAPNRITVNAQPKTGNTLPSLPWFRGERFILLVDDTVSQDHLGDDADIALYAGEPSAVYYFDGGNTTLTNNGPNFIVGFSAAASVATLRDKVYVHTAGTYQMPTDAKLIFYREGSDRAEFDIADTVENRIGGDTRLSFLYEVAGLSYTDLDAEYRYAINFSSATSGAQMYPTVTVSAGDLTYAGSGHGTAGWINTPGVAASWATEGNPPPYTSFALTELVDGTVTPGVNVVNSSASPASTFNLFDPVGTQTTFDLDDDANRVGVVNVETTLTFATRSSNSIGFTTQQPVASLSTRDTDFVFARNLRALTAWTSSARTGITVASTPIDLGTTKLGDVLIKIGKNANNELGWYWEYVGASGSQNFTIGISMSADFEHNDRAAASNFLSLTDVYPTTYSGVENYNVVVGAGGGLVFTNAPALQLGTRSATQVPINLLRGASGTTLLPATSSLAGIMTAADKTRLDGLNNPATWARLTGATGTAPLSVIPTITEPKLDIGNAPTANNILGYDANGMVWTNAPSGGATTLLGLTDTPSQYQDDQILVSFPDSNSFVYRTIPASAANWARASGRTGTAPLAAIPTITEPKLDIGGTPDSGEFLGYDVNGMVWTNAPAGSVGLTTAQVNDIVESYTGQTADSPGSDFALNRIPQITSAQIQNNTIANADISATANIDGSKIANNSIGTEEIEANGVGSSELAPNSVGAGDIQAGSIVNADIFSGANIAGSKIADNSVGGAKIVDDSITEPKLDIGGTPNSGEFLGYDVNGMVWTNAPAGVAVDNPVTYNSSLPNTGTLGQVIVVDEKHYEWARENKEKHILNFVSASRFGNNGFQRGLGAGSIGSTTETLNRNISIIWNSSGSFLEIKLGPTPLPNPPTTLYGFLRQGNNDRAAIILRGGRLDSNNDWTYAGINLSPQLYPSLSTTYTGPASIELYTDNIRTRPYNFVTGPVDEWTRFTDFVDLNSIDAVNTGSDNQILARNSAGLVWTNDMTASGGTGQTLSQVNARIRAHTLQRSDTDLINAHRLGTGTTNSTTILYGDGTWKTAPSGGAGLTQSQVDARVVAYTGQTAGTPTGTFNLNRVPTITEPKLDIGNDPTANNVLGYDANGLVWTNVSVSVGTTTTTNNTDITFTRQSNGNYHGDVKVGLEDGSEYIITFFDSSGRTGVNRGVLGQLGFVFTAGTGTEASSGATGNVIGVFWNGTRYNFGSSSDDNPSRAFWLVDATDLTQTRFSVVGITTTPLYARIGKIEETDSSISFASLSDTPESITANQYLRGNASGDALEFVSAPSGGATTFAALTDTPTTAELTTAQGDLLIVAPSANDITTLSELTSDYIQDGTIANADISATANIDGSKIANDSIGTEEIEANGVGASELADNAVDTGAIAAGAVQNLDIADNAVTTSKIQNFAVNANKIQSNAVNSSKIASNSISDAKIINNTITEPKLNIGNSPTTGNILGYDANGLVWTNDMTGTGGGGLTTAQVNTRIRAHTGQTSDTGTFALNRIPQITAAQLAANSVGASELSDNSVDLNAIDTTNTGSANQVLARSSSAIYWKSDVGLNQTQVDARVSAYTGQTSASDQIDPTRLGTGTRSSSTILYGDGVFRTAPSGGGATINQATQVQATIELTGIWSTNVNNAIVTENEIAPTTISLRDIEGDTGATGTNITLSEDDDEFTFNSAGAYTITVAATAIMATTDGGSTTPSSSDGGSRLYPYIWIERQVEGNTAWNEMPDTRRQGYTKQRSAQGPSRTTLGTSTTFLASANDKYRLRAGGYLTRVQYASILTRTNAIRIVRHAH